MSPSVRRLVELFAREIDVLVDRRAKELAEAARAQALRRLPEKPDAPTQRRSTRGTAASDRRERRRRKRRDPRPATSAMTPAEDPPLARPLIGRETGPLIDLRERGGNPAADPGVLEPEPPAAGGADDGSGAVAVALAEPWPQDDGARVEVLEELAGAPAAPDDPGASPAEADPADWQVKTAGAVVEYLQVPATDPAPAPAHEGDSSSFEVEKEEVLAPPPARRQKTCSVCGEPGHNARRHPRHDDPGGIIFPKSFRSNPPAEPPEQAQVSETVEEPLGHSPVEYSPEPARTPRGWDRDDPDQDFTDLAPEDEVQAAPPLDPGPVEVPDVSLARVAGSGRRARANQQRRLMADQVDRFGLLDERDRLVCQLYVDGKKYPDIARELGVQVYDVSNSLSRARRRLADGVEQRVSCRKRTISLQRLTREERRASEDLKLPADIEMPRKRGECQEDRGRPCPWVRCRHHNYLDVDPRTGAMTLNFPHLEVWQIPESCSLDVADRDGVTLEQVGAALNLTRERIRQMETAALARGRRRNPNAIDMLPEDGPRESPLASVMSD